MKIAITGSIGSGKSLASAYLRQLGYPVYDTDTMVHAYYEPDGAAYKDLIKTFGEGILDASGRIDRRRLGDLVFQDAALLKALEEVVYPYLKQDIVAMPHQGTIVFYEVPVLFESGFEIYFDRILMINTLPTLAYERLLKRGMRPGDITSRLKHQMSPEQKAKRSDFVIDNNSSIDDFKQQIDVFMKHLEQGVSL